MRGMLGAGVGAVKESAARLVSAWGFAYNRGPELPWHTLPYAIARALFRPHAAMPTDTSFYKASGEQV